MRGITYFRCNGFSINEGSGPVNIHMSWCRYGLRFFFYIYFFGLQFSWAWKKRKEVIQMGCKKGKGGKGGGGKK